MSMTSPFDGGEDTGRRGVCSDAESFFLCVEAEEDDDGERLYASDGSASSTSAVEPPRDMVPGDV